MIHSHCDSRGNANSFAKAPGSLSAPQTWEPQPQFQTVDLRARCAHKGKFFLRFLAPSSPSLLHLRLKPPRQTNLPLCGWPQFTQKRTQFSSMDLPGFWATAQAHEPRALACQSTWQGSIPFFGPALEKRPPRKRACSTNCPRQLHA